VSSDDRFTFVLAALLATTVLLGGSHGRRPQVVGGPDKPRVGRDVSEVQVGPVAAEDANDAPRDDSKARAEERVKALLAARRWPDFARSLVFHPLAETELPGAGLEEGPPYHVVIEADGAIVWTGRGTAGSRAQPPGLPFKAATDAVHVALPACRSATADAAASVRALWTEGARRFGAAAVVFADEVPGSTIRLPEGFDRASCLGPQESRATQTRPREPETQPASRAAGVKLRVGTATIGAAVASTGTARGEGLMGRTSLQPDEGLLFVYRVAEPRTFWMKNCKIPLDIIYVADDGRVLSIVTAPPPDPKTSDVDLARYASPAPCRLVLEIAGGRGAQLGIKPGTRIGLPDGMDKLFEKAEP
jgi:uncharacterized membrane protein (UPF0127 family)